MSRSCPHCGLFNPDESLRCDCGYDFHTQSMQRSYVVADLVQKQGGPQRFLEKQARDSFRSGLVMLVVGVGITVITYIIASADASGSGHGTYWIAWGAILSGLGLLFRSAKMRRAAERIAELESKEAQRKL